MKAVGRCLIAGAAALVSSLPLEARARDETIERLRLGSGFEIVIGEKQPDPGGRLLEALAIWVGAKLGQPVPASLPRLVFKRADQVAVLRFKQYASEIVTQRAQPTIISIYDSRENTIYLRDTWSGATAADLSVLVHELVHHFQEVHQAKFECDAAREAAAFELQEKWLRLFGESLEEDFQIDPFTLLVRTSCGM
ncbi:conserved hypothetical protein [Bosea sp. 62]|uniref:DUF6647 family protein n=1 Tax=unclassified Bosea (in: a-proteobacteria) TaxID=2653178 RepID=UPI00125A27E5|nr:MULTISPECIES: DUF6647 family protein [unclassified Bosea (in: a-proteobacteria)]CAD5255174.1 conserved hypothetical protein [Bosea sp. 21B]CAD5285124.1 conserved hypothetical protein [Bosea sp. 7B]CAD5301587.1 conserved hypothetical protein [Bosea sp. 46]VVT57705.1 conserved hypothetical protein [Bosea sp. EC-HK365B]VXB29817.1 conserved hypothetical protein [Bosea sp. 29B]